MHHLDSYKSIDVKQHKNAIYSSEQILKAAHHKQLLFGQKPPISQTIQVKRTRTAGYCWRSKGKLIIIFSYEGNSVAYK